MARHRHTIPVIVGDETYKFAPGLGAAELGAFGRAAADYARARAADTDATTEVEVGEMPFELVSSASAMFEAACCEWEGVEDEHGNPLTCNLTNRQRTIEVAIKVTAALMYLGAANSLGESETPPAEPPTESTPPQSTTDTPSPSTA